MRQLEPGTPEWAAACEQLTREGLMTKKGKASSKRKRQSAPSPPPVVAEKPAPEEAKPLERFEVKEPSIPGPKGKQVVCLDCNEVYLRTHANRKYCPPCSDRRAGQTTAQCKACGEAFRKVGHQLYCRTLACNKERKKRAEAARRAEDIARKERRLRAEADMRKRMPNVAEVPEERPAPPCPVEEAQAPVSTERAVAYLPRSAPALSVRPAVATKVPTSKADGWSGPALDAWQELLDEMWEKGAIDAERYLAGRVEVLAIRVGMRLECLGDLGEGD